MNVANAPMKYPGGSSEATATEDGAVVRARNVAITFEGQKVIDQVSFDVHRGELVVLQGENGTGKTVLLNVLSGYVKPNQGTVRLRLGGAWVDATQTGPVTLAQLGLGRLWQDVRLFPTLTVLDNVLAATPSMLGNNPALALLAWPWGIRQERAVRERALENLARVGMEDRAFSSCDMLSVGQMKRVSIARLLQMNATLLLLDEPLAGLDDASADVVMDDISRLCHDHGLTTFVVEHRPDAFRKAVDRTWILRNGSLVEGGGLRG